MAYDVSTMTAEGRRRLRRIAKICEGFGQRVQESVFECTVSEAQLELMEARLVRAMVASEDSLRIYRLLEPRAKYLRAHGREREPDLHGVVIL